MSVRSLALAAAAIALALGSMTFAVSPVFARDCAAAAPAGAAGPVALASFRVSRAVD